MLIRELFRDLVADERVSLNKPILVYDPTKEDYIEATGYAVRPDGSIELQTPD